LLLNNKVALVTGGSRGIGKGIVVALANAGASVAFSYNVNDELAKDIADEIRSNGHEALALQLRVEDRLSVQNAISIVKKKFGSIDILVNNAAVSQEKPFDTINDSDWDNMMATNLKGPFICTQEVLPDMLSKGWGRVINISSIGGQWGGFNQVHYAASKAALINLTKSLAKIYSSKGITTNSIAPGLVQTDMAARELNSDAGREKVKNIPAGRIATVEEIAAAVVFLAMEESGYITGQTININGGMYFG
jgi:NAD(P)-dependent dehydrogenase (short-subunit alcohol dehydrogenase family)